MDFNPNLKFKQIKIESHKKLLTAGKSDISLTQILSSEKCQSIISESREFRDRIYTPLKTLLMFTKQILHTDKSCKNAVAGAFAEQISIGKKPISTNTGPYCKARERLPEVAVKQLVKETGRLLEKSAIKKWRWRGHELKAVDGTTVTMPSTKENIQAFPLHKNQQGDIGFPMARLVAIVSLSVGTILDYAVGASKGDGTGEHSLLRTILSSVNERDVILGDQLYPSFFLMADLISRSAEGLFAGMSKRNYDFRMGECLSKNDHIVCWQKPIKPLWMDKEAYDAFPCKIRVREFKVCGRVYITTLMNDKKYHKKELTELYELRWHIELTIRNIKVTMNMDVLSCKTPEMAKKEVGIHFLGYNMIRGLIAEACFKNDSIPCEVSFKGSVQLLNQFMPYFNNSDENINKEIFSELLRIMIKNKIGNRPGRQEPRAVKSDRRKKFRILKKPRIVEKEWLIHKREKRISRYPIS
jgi:hypothetical protein